MKKAALATFVIVTFVLYVLTQKGLNASSSGSSNMPMTSTPEHAGTSLNASVSSTHASGANYKDGQYVGTVGDAFYGPIQVQATISGGKLTDVVFVQFPNDQPNSIEINSQAMPLLKQEAITAQSAKVDGVTGATDTSQAFVQSLSDALNQAKA